MWLCSPNPAAPNPGGPSCWGGISFPDGNKCVPWLFLCTHRRAGTATLAGEDKSMVTMQENKNGRGNLMNSKWSHPKCHPAFEFAIWMAQEMRAATSVCHPYSVGFSSRFLKPGCKQWVTERKEGYFWDFGSTEEKHETARNDREVRVLDDGKQHMGSRGEGDLASLLQYYIPAQLTLISGGQFISAGRIWLLGLQVQNEKLSISRAPMLVFAKCFLFSIPPCKSFFFF